MTHLALEKAWKRRQPDFSRLQAVRVFHGPSEGDGALKNIAIEKFDNHFWIFEWEDHSDLPASAELFLEIVEFLKNKSAQSIVHLERPKGQTPEASPKILFGKPPEYIDVLENQARFRIRFQNTRHPGLFLDHEPLRQWLLAGGLLGQKVLNTFSYTGSLSVSALLGGAAFVKTLDLSKPTLAWAKENAEINNIDPQKTDYIYGDYFEWLPRFQKKYEIFDAIILDPPSFSRGSKGTFSTNKDLVRLHELALMVLKPKGILITSINSAKLSREHFLSEVQAASYQQKRKLKIIQELGAPAQSFPRAHYLKGWIFEAL